MMSGRLSAVTGHTNPGTLWKGRWRVSPPSWTREQHPRDFRAVVKYRTLAPGGYRSVGFSFDYVDQGNSQDVYTSTNDSSPSVQAFHRAGGGQGLSAGRIVVRTPLSIGEMTTLEVEVRGPLLTINLNGERKLEYALPVERPRWKVCPLGP